MKKIKVLLAEDDTNLGNILQDYLELENFDVTLCRDGEEGLKTFQKDAPFDLCIFDVMMPKKDGFTLAREVRSENKQVPILFLTAKSLKEDKIEGFEIGADDYITKPFNEEELVLRIKAILKRTTLLGTEEETHNIFKIGQYAFDSQRQDLIFGDEVRRLTAKESEILRLLLSRKDAILKREDALVAIWGKNDYFLGRSFDVFITKLRKYFKDDTNIRIENIHGVGFMITDKA
jgi:DNA-binding response OmpR family regulator